VSGQSKKTVVVTGAGSGVGRAVVQRFAAEGWHVGLVGRRLDALRETVGLLPADVQARCVVLPCDVGHADAVAQMATDALRQLGHVDVLVNSAGINVRHRSLEVLSLEDWHRVLDTNLHGAYYCIRAFLPSMRDRRDGTIVNINSDVGKVARDLAGPAYVTSKFGLAGLTQQINAEERQHGIRATSIFPRDVNTPLLDQRPQPPPAEARARMLQPEDLAACVWLAASLPAHAIVDEIALSTR
jgi:NAD(P)-dependent dehydrogenase (short-subunit alcohol dehydrogenase family)